MSKLISKIKKIGMKKKEKLKRKNFDRDFENYYGKVKNFSDKMRGFFFFF